GSVDIPGREIGPGTGAVVFMLDPHRASRRRSQRGVLTATSLDAGFLVGAENELGGPQGPTVPASLVQVENASCFFGELRGWGEKRAGRPPRGSSSRPGSRARANRLRHLLTICRGVSRREAMTSLERPSAARRTILARMISQYGDVYLRALDWSCPRSSLVSLIRNGLELGKPVTSAETKSSPEPNVKARTIRHRIYETEYLATMIRAGSVRMTAGLFAALLSASRSEEHTSELSHQIISYAVFCLKK